MEIKNKNFQYSVFLLILIFPQMIFSQNSGVSDTLKVMTLNLYGNPTSNWENRQRMILDELENLQPDLIGLQEVIDPGGGAETWAELLANELFARTGIRYEYLYSKTHFSWNTWDEGVGILSKHPILENAALTLPTGLFPRKVIWARVLTPAGIVNFFDTHLSFGNREPARIAQVKKIKTFIAQKSADNIAAANFLCGDFNAIPTSAPVRLLTLPDTNGVVFRDSWAVSNPGNPGFTVPSDNPDARIDYVLLRDGDKGEIVRSRRVFVQPNAGGLFASDHIAVLSTFIVNGRNLGVEITSPVTGSEVAGETLVSWSFSSRRDSLLSTLFISADGGQSWREEWSGTDSTYLWNTQSVSDGTQYMLRVMAIKDSSYGIGQTAGTFTVNNPGNGAPEIELLSPPQGAIIEGDFPVRWHAADADGDALLISLKMSDDNGATWQALAADLPNSGEYLWNTRSFPNQSLYKLMITAADDSLAVSDQSGSFSLANPRFSLPDSIFKHISGSGDGNVRGNIVDGARLTNHLYRVTFDDTSGEQTTYSVLDVDADSIVLHNSDRMDGNFEGPEFDGLRLTPFNYTEASLDLSQTGWISGNTNLTQTIIVPTLVIGGQIINGVAFPANYKITIFDQVVDTSSTFLGVPATPVKFTMENITENRQVEVLFLDTDNDQTISKGDRLFPLEKDANGDPLLTWQITFTGPASPVLPMPGDQFLMSTFKPFTHNDVFEFSTVTVGINDEGTEHVITKFSLEQNYPNPFNPTTFIRYQLLTDSKVRLIIFNILGQKVATLVNKKQPTGSYSAIWNGTDRSGKRVASGIYIYRLETGSGFAQSRKMLLLK